MIFFAGSLNMNGGSTFLLRVAKQYRARGERMAVVVLSNVVDDAIHSELQPLADVIMLRDLLHPLFRRAGSNQLAIYLPNDRRKVRELLAQHGHAVHVMGIFGLVLAMRWLSLCPGIRITAGVYHQNEYLFEAGDAFSRKVRQLFCQLPEKNVLYFNEFTREAYSRFFGKDYSSAMILPIGIPVPGTPVQQQRPYVPGLVVSVGNLVAFKTYNEHVIRLAARLRARHPALRYEIYGTGENLDKLVSLAAELGVADIVDFRGAIPYEEFPKVVGKAMAFVGSGTALIEAAAQGVPAIVGIESIPTPETYGFISDVEGLSYNEKIAGRPLVSMESLLARLLDSDDEVAVQGRACARKATEFSIDKTVDGLRALGVTAAELHAARPAAYWTRLMSSFVKVAMLDRLGIDRTLRERRNQSSHV